MEDGSIVLIGKEKTSVVVPIHAAVLMKTIGDLIKDAGSDQPVPVPEIDTATLKTIAGFCQAQAQNPKSLDIAQGFASSLADDRDALVKVTLAAEYLDIPALLDACIEQYVEKLRGQSTATMRARIGIADDWRSGEEAFIRKENAWSDATLI